MTSTLDRASVLEQQLYEPTEVWLRYSDTDPTRAGYQLMEELRATYGYPCVVFGNEVAARRYLCEPVRTSLVRALEYARSNDLSPVLCVDDTGSVLWKVLP